MRPSLTYSDISIVPFRKSNIKSRDEIDTSGNFLGLNYCLPILSAPMRTVTGSKMAMELQYHGVIPVLHRTSIWENDWNQFKATGMTCIIPSIAATGDFIDRARLYFDSGAKAICIDTANGFSIILQEAVQELKVRLPTLKIIAGNIGSLEGYRFMNDIGVDAVRVGIGNGSACSTSIATGVGVGQVSLLQEIAQFRSLTNIDTPEVIADGGIKEPGDISKALALGADMVMLGSMLAGTEEAPGELRKDSNGRLCKLYAGEASRSSKGESSKYVEGVSTLLPYKGPVKEIINEISDGLKSSMSYLDAKTLKEFRNLGDHAFVQLSENARYERMPHILGR